jgi:mannose-6-phosphate isomerase-like protein (cupin superfamily)
MPPTPVNLSEKLNLIGELWSPRIIARCDDYDVKVAKLKGDFVWHRHPDTDEVFLVLEGQLRIDFRDGSVALNAGEMIVVPKEVEHKPFAAAECHVLLLERRGTVNTGTAPESDLTADIDARL